MPHLERTPAQRGSGRAPFRALRGACLALAASALGGSSASAQVQLYTFHGDDSFDHLGDAVSGAGDVNGDGRPDVIAGGYRDETNGNAAGLARVYSGLDGCVLYTFYGVAAGDQFGDTVGAAGDVNNDGYDDVIIGARYTSTSGPDSRNAYVYSGLDGALLYRIEGDPSDDFVVGPVAGVGDLNADGFDDFMVGEPFNDTAGNNAGAARVYSGVDGCLMYELFGSAFEKLGSSVSAAGDVNADGTPDLLVGGDSNSIGAIPGKAWVYSGLDGSLLHVFVGPGGLTHFGRQTSGAGDVDGDGYADVIVSAEDDDTGGSAAGMARVYSGFDGSVLHTILGTSAGARLGVSVSEAGDRNGDGFDDVLVGLVDDIGPAGTGGARIFSGEDGSLLHILVSYVPNDGFGRSVDSAGDVDGDGAPDYVVGAYAGDVNGQDAGTVYVLSVAPPYTPYCIAAPNSTALGSHLSATGYGRIGGQEIVLTADHLPAGSSGLFIMGRQETLVPAGDGFRCIGGPVLRLFPEVTPDASGVVSRSLDAYLPPGSSLITAGSTWKFQCWYRDPGPAIPTFNLSDALSIEFQP